MSRKKPSICSLALYLTAAIFSLGACGHAPESLEEIKSALDSELGGYQLDEELPLFGRDDLDLGPLSSRFALPAIPDMGYPSPLIAAGPEGRLEGFWIDYEKGYGVMAGKWADSTGKVRGHLKGIYGHSRTYSDWVFFGKLIDRRGRALGVLNGRHIDGMFRGTLVDERRAILGELVGYASAKGLFRGRWKTEPQPESRGVGEMPWHLLR